MLEDCIARFPHGLATGDAGWTVAGDLPARWVIHTVGPNYRAGQRDRRLLESCYRRALEVADELSVETLAFPLISAGIYAWPREDAIDAAVTTLRGRRPGSGRSASWPSTRTRTPGSLPAWHRRFEPTGVEEVDRPSCRNHPRRWAGTRPQAGQLYSSLSTWPGVIVGDGHQQSVEPGRRRGTRRRPCRNHPNDEQTPNHKKANSTQVPAPSRKRPSGTATSSRLSRAGDEERDAARAETTPTMSRHPTTRRPTPLRSLHQVGRDRRGRPPAVG
ncbi:macro domain-containing protein [Tessaracoccus coleopterorum]|uniref:macro domain-containing protein n=1 Tax=Tessaracoccus coleopterorum TaxID=2714950 RepID=UPI002F90C9E0